MTVVIDVHDLVQTFGPVRALNGLDLQVSEGQVRLLGAERCGHIHRDVIRGSAAARYE